MFSYGNILYYASKETSYGEKKISQSFIFSIFSFQTILRTRYKTYLCSVKEWQKVHKAYIWCAIFLHGGFWQGTPFFIITIVQHLFWRWSKIFKGWEKGMFFFVSLLIGEIRYLLSICRNILKSYQWHFIFLKEEVLQDINGKRSYRSNM